MTPKFKVGDRVVVAYAPEYARRECLGFEFIVEDLMYDPDYGCYMYCYTDQDNHRCRWSECYLELHEVYSSPLYKALS